MAAPRDYTFTIDAYTPETIGMERLALYMADLARLLGEKEKVHFVRLESGSVGIVHRIEKEAQPKVASRLRGVPLGDAPAEAVEAFAAINLHLAEDDGVAVLADERGAAIIEFPGRTRQQPESHGPITEEGTLEGRVVAVGGKGADAYVHLLSEGTTFPCKAEHKIAKELAAYLFTPTVLRVYGTGKWRRDAKGDWHLEGFAATRYTPLDATPLQKVMAELQAIPGSEWPTISDPFSALASIRRGAAEAK